MSSKTKTTATKEEAAPALVPKLRFPEFREAEGWKETPLHKIARPVSDRAVTGDGDNVLSLSGEHGLVLQSDYFGKKVAGDSAERYLKLVRNDFVYNDRTTKASAFGTIKRLSKYEGGIVSPIYKCFRFLGDENPVFWEWYFESGNHDTALRGLVNEGARAGRFNISITQFLSTAAPRPDEAEQQKIAECLSSVDELMAAQARKVDALKTHKKGLMQQLFPREGETQPRLRFPEFQNAGEWVLTSVGGLVEANSLFPPKDGNHGNIHPKSADYVAQGIPFIMASDLNGGLIDIETCHFISKEQADKLQKGFAKEGDVLLSHKGTVGEVAVVKKIHTPYLMLTPQVTYYRVKDPKKLSNEFLAQLFFSDTFQSNLLELSGGGTRSYIGITEQAKLRVRFPKDVVEQQRIATCLGSLDALIAAETQKHEALKTQKKGLMQQLFPSPEEVEA